LFNVRRGLAEKTFYWRDNLSLSILATGEEVSETINCVDPFPLWKTIQKVEDMCRCCSFEKLWLL